MAIKQRRALNYILEFSVGFELPSSEQIVISDNPKHFPINQLWNQGWENRELHAIINPIKLKFDISCKDYGKYLVPGQPQN